MGTRRRASSPSGPDDPPMTPRRDAPRVGVFSFQPRPRRAAPACAMLACAAALAACQAQTDREEPERDFFGRPLNPEASKAEAPSFEPVVLSRTGAPAREDDGLRERRALDEDDAGWGDKLELARTLEASGEQAQALAVLDAAIAAQPPTAWAQRFKQVKQELRLRQNEQDLVRIDVRAVKDVVPFATMVEFRLRIRNVSQEDLVFQAGAVERDPRGRPLPGAAERSPNAVTLDVVRRDRDVTAAAMDRSWTTTVPLQGPGSPDLRLAPGETREFPVRIPAEDVGAPIAGVRVIEISGVLRPTAMTVGGLPQVHSLRVRKGRVVVLPGGYEPLAEDPLGGMEQAIPLGAGAHLLVATEFVPRAQAPQAALLLARALSEGEPGLAPAAQGALAMLRERCVGDPLAPLLDPLMASLESRPRRSAELLGGVAALTDERLASDPRLWQDWWRRTRPTGPVVTDPRATQDPEPRTSR